MNQQSECIVCGRPASISTHFPVGMVCDEHAGPLALPDWPTAWPVRWSAPDVEQALAHVRAALDALRIAGVVEADAAQEILREVGVTSAV